MSDQQVRPNSLKLTDGDARHLLADGLLRVCHHNKLARVALEVGCDEKTIRRARDEESTLNLACSWNLLDVDPTALDAIAAAKGFFLRPMARNAQDIVPSAGATLHRIGMARDPYGPGGATETDEELIGMESEVNQILASAELMKSRIAAAKLRRAGIAS